MIPAHPFSDRRKAISNIHYSALPEVLGAFLWLHAVWETNFSSAQFVDTVAVGGLALPCQATAFQVSCFTVHTVRAVYGQAFTQ
jgi:hypothetical protein